MKTFNIFFYQANPGSSDSRPAPAEESSQEMEMKNPEIFKPVNTWNNEERNVSV